MKHIVTGILILAFAMIAYSQPPESSTDRKLASAVRKVESRIKTLETFSKSAKPIGENRLRRTIDNATRDLDKLKSAFPNYDSSKLEAKVNNLVDSLKNAQQSGIAKDSLTSSLVEEVESILTFRPDVSAFISNRPDAPAVAETMLEEFKNRMAAQINADHSIRATDVSDRGIVRLRRRVTDAAAAQDRWVNDFRLTKFRESDKTNLVLSKYYQVLFANQKFNLLAQLFPDISQVESTRIRLEALVAELGTKDQLVAAAEKNYAERVARVRMSPEVKSDAALRRAFVVAFTNYRSRPTDFNNGQILKVNLQNSDWIVERNELTGIILSRRQYAEVAFKSSNGRCFLYTFGMEQKSHGRRYGSGYGVSSRETEILCTNIPQ